MTSLYVAPEIRVGLRLGTTTSTALAGEPVSFGNVPCPVGAPAPHDLVGAGPLWRRQRDEHEGLGAPARALEVAAQAQSDPDLGGDVERGHRGRLGGVDRVRLRRLQGAGNGALDGGERAGPGDP